MSEENNRANCASERDGNTKMPLVGMQSHGSQVMINEALKATHQELLYPAYYDTFKFPLKSISNIERPKKSTLEPSIDTFQDVNRILDITNREKIRIAAQNAKSFKSILTNKCNLSKLSRQSMSGNVLMKSQASNLESQPSMQSGIALKGINELLNQPPKKRYLNEDFESEKRIKTNQELVPLEDKLLERNQKIIRQVAMSLSIETFDDQPFYEWLKESLLHKHQDSGIQTKRKIIQATLRRYLEEELNQPIIRMPWARISNQGIINWPARIKVQDIERINAIDLNNILEILDRLQFTQESLRIIKTDCKPVRRGYDRKRQSVSDHFRSLMNNLGIKSFKVPWIKLKPRDVDGWPQDIEIRKPRLYKKEELYRILDNLDKIRFSQHFLDRLSKSASLLSFNRNDLNDYSQSE